MAKDYTVKINPELIKEYEGCSAVYYEVTGEIPKSVKAIEDTMRYFIKKIYPAMKIVKQVRNDEPID